MSITVFPGRNTANYIEEIVPMTHRNPPQTAALR